MFSAVSDFKVWWRWPEDRFSLARWPVQSADCFFKHSHEAINYENKSNTLLCLAFILVDYFNINYRCRDTIDQPWEAAGFVRSGENQFYRASSVLRGNARSYRHGLTQGARKTTMMAPEEVSVAAASCSPKNGPEWFFFDRKDVWLQ